MKNLIAIAIAFVLVSGFTLAQTPSGMDASRSPSVQQEQEVKVETLAFKSQKCKQCQLDKKELEKLRAAGHVIREIDVDAEPRLANQYNITRLPTYVVEKNGVEVKRTGDVGVLSAFLIAFLVWLFC